MLFYMQFEFEFLFLYVYNIFIRFIILYFIIYTPAKYSLLKRNWINWTLKVNKSNTFRNSLIKFNLENKYYFISNSLFYSLTI